MKATGAKRDLLRMCVVSCFVLLLSCSLTRGGAAVGRKIASQQRALTRSRRSHQSARPKGANSHQQHHHSGSGSHHRPLTDEQKADQNLQFMLSLYRSAAEPDGRPKQNRKFDSNTVRLLRPSASSVRHLPASRDHHYRFTVQYSLDTVPSEQLIRASFIHLRSSSSSSSSARCRAQISSLGEASLVTLEPHQRWTETDITAHVRRGEHRGPGRRLTLTAQYWCTEEEEEVEEGGGGLPGWWFRKKRRRGDPHLSVPSLLLYLQDEREVTDWMGGLLGAAGAANATAPRLGPWHPSLQRRRRSKDAAAPDALKHASSSSTSFSTSPSSSIISDIPGVRRGAAAPKKRCKLHSFRLSFDSLGWGDYFIAPPVYDPRFCQGDCPAVLTYEYHSPNHAVIQTLLSELGVGDVPAPSCVPYKYMPMSVLVMDKKKVEYRTLEDMLAESCTCR